MVPNGDLFKALHHNKASIVTDHIERFVENGILLKSGKTLEADIIVTATGLNLQTLGGMQLYIDDKLMPTHQAMTYKGVLIQDAPNFAYLFGYTNASWTLKLNIAADYLCRLYNHMDAKAYTVATPHDNEGCATDKSMLDSLGSGYVQRASAHLPRQGNKQPWMVLNDFRRDTEILGKHPIEDGILQFT